MWFAYVHTASGRLLGLGTSERPKPLPRGVVELTFDQTVSPMENANWDGSGFTPRADAPRRTLAELVLAEPELALVDPLTRGNIQTVLDRLSTSGSVR